MIPGFLSFLVLFHFNTSILIFLYHVMNFSRLSNTLIMNFINYRLIIKISKCILFYEQDKDENVHRYTVRGKKRDIEIEREKERES